MKSDKHIQVADEENSVGAIYKKKNIAHSYLEKRLKFSWQRLLHQKQVSAINNIIKIHRPNSILELAPGPARLAIDIKGVKQGVMVENSEEMISIALDRLSSCGLDHVWKMMEGNAFCLDKIIPDESFDLVYTFRFIRHFQIEEREKLYELIRKALRKNAILIFDVVNAPIREKIEAKYGSVSIGDIAVYDMSYTISTFTEEMQTNGFKVIEMIPIVRHFLVQSLLSYKLDDVIPYIAQKVVYWFENIPSKQPLEWVAICQKLE